jgi:Family of unknown function (DUF6508)
MRYAANPGLVAEAELETSRNLITAHIRGDRFTAGHLRELIGSGHIGQILRRLSALSV